MSWLYPHASCEFRNIFPNVPFPSSIQCCCWKSDVLLFLILCCGLVPLSGNLSEILSWFLVFWNFMMMCLSVRFYDYYLLCLDTQWHFLYCFFGNFLLSILSEYAVHWIWNSLINPLNFILFISCFSNLYLLFSTFCEIASTSSSNWMLFNYCTFNF